MSRASLPPDDARDWNRILARLENVENKLRELSSQDTPTKFGDLDDVDTIFAADQSVATFDADTGKVLMKAGGTAATSEVLTATVSIDVTGSPPFTGTLEWVHTAGSTLMDIGDTAAPKFAAGGTYHLIMLSNYLSEIDTSDPDHPVGSIAIPYYESTFPDNPQVEPQSFVDLFSLFTTVGGLSGIGSIPLDVLEDYGPILNFDWRFNADDRFVVNYLTIAADADEFDSPAVFHAKLYVLKHT